MQQLKKEKGCELLEILKRLSLCLAIPIVSMIYPILNRYRGNLHILKLPIDDLIPFSKIFILPYASWSPFVATFLIILCILDKEKYFKLLSSLVIGMLICYLIYYIYPTYVERPFVENKDFLDKVVLWVYGRDNPYNCWPSIHVLNSFLVAMYTSSSKKINILGKTICITIAILIMLGTMFVKQHYLLDVVAGIALGSGLYFGLEVFVNYVLRDKIKEKVKTLAE
ncbi:MAG: phosphatase PAP2 family protein [Clostridium sp.]|nr:phosphatase PAP2 family protein [Clostridium sp.]